jgi:hypothetical protein
MLNGTVTSDKLLSVCESVWSYFYLMLICASLFYLLLYSYFASRNRKGESESYYPVQRPWLCICQEMECSYLIDHRLPGFYTTYIKSLFILFNQLVRNFKSSCSWETRFNNISNVGTIDISMLLEHLWWRLFQKRFVRTKFYLLGFVNYKKGALDSQQQVIKFTSCLPMGGGSLRVLQLLPPLRLVAMI